MSRFLTARMAALPAYVPGTHAERNDVIRLNSNESPFPPSKEVQEAVIRVLGGLNYYNDPDCTELLAALAEHSGVKPENVMASNGSDQALYFAFMAFAGEERPILLPDVTYGYYTDFAAALGVRLIRRPLREDYTIDPDDYKRKGAMVCFPNPNAPTGLALNHDQLREILEADRERVVLIDEAYADFGTESVLPLISEYDNLLIVRTFSKSGSLAGGRLGYALGSRQLISELSAVRSSIDLYGVSRMAQAAGVAACRSWEYYAANCRKIMEARAYALGELRKMGCEATDSLGNFLFVRPPMDAALLQKKLAAAGILVRYWDEPRLADRLRISVGTMEDMKTLCDQIRRILEEKP